MRTANLAIKLSAVLLSALLVISYSGDSFPPQVSSQLQSSADKPAIGMHCTAAFKYKIIQAGDPVILQLSARNTSKQNVAFPSGHGRTIEFTVLAEDNKGQQPPKTSYGKKYFLGAPEPLSYSNFGTILRPGESV